MPRSTSPAIVLRGAAITIIVLSVGLVLLALAGNSAGEISLPLFIAVAALVLSIGIGAALWALGTSFGSRKADEVFLEQSRSLIRIQTQINELTTKVLHIDEAIDRIARTQENVITQSSPLALGPSDLEPLYEAIREVRELSILPDADRRERLDRHRTETRTSNIRKAFDLVAARQWHDAERHVLALETTYPNDPDVYKARNYLNSARKLNEQETVSQTGRTVEELMASSNWDEALSRARTLVEGFPDNGAARSLFIRVQRERDMFHESTVARMFDDLRNDIDRRSWRHALKHAQVLLQKFPTHPRAEGVRRQFKTIQDNAEIEERQELEVRIQELIREQRFEEAIELGEDVMRRFPLSPQAESLDVLLPRLRQLAIEGVESLDSIDDAFSSPFDSVIKSRDLQPDDEEPIISPPHTL